MKVLAIEPYYGGSHAAFLEGWIARSKHSWTVMQLPPNKWKWRMRHAPITLSGAAAEQADAGASWDVMLCSDMLGLAEFRGMLPASLRGIPAVAYFHENQLTYPVAHRSEFDYHFAFSNMMTALAAHSVWFNSEFHRESFITASLEFIRRMPDYQPVAEIEGIMAKSRVLYPGVEEFPKREERHPGPIRILWSARWEYDKDPKSFFRALKLLHRAGVDFEVSVIGGGNAREIMPAFGEARGWLGERVRHWGYLSTREEYRRVLLEADVAVSTAQHEFYGIAMVEAAAAGAYPLVPDRLAYPELFGRDAAPGSQGFLYEGDAKHLADRLCELNGLLVAGDLWSGDPDCGIRAVGSLGWKAAAPALDTALDAVVDGEALSNR